MTTIESESLPLENTADFSDESKKALNIEETLAPVTDEVKEEVVEKESEQESSIYAEAPKEEETPQKKETPVQETEVIEAPTLEEKTEVKEQATLAPVKEEVTKTEPEEPATKEPVKEIKKEEPVVVEETEEPTEIVARTKFRLAQMYRNTTSLSDLTFQGLFLWNNWMASLIVYLSSWFALSLLRNGYSLTTLLLLGATLQLSLAGFFTLLNKFVPSINPGSFLPSFVDVSPQSVKSYLASGEKKINQFIAQYIHILSFKEPKLSLGVLAGTFTTFYMTKCLRDTTIILLALNVAFLAPLAHFLFKEEMKKGFCVAKTKAKELVEKHLSKHINTILSKIPRHSSAVTAEKKEQ